jgi:hypothetical protein
MDMKVGDLVRVRWKMEGRKWKGLGVITGYCSDSSLKLFNVFFAESGEELPFWQAQLEFYNKVEVEDESR